MVYVWYMFVICSVYQNDKKMMMTEHVLSDFLILVYMRYTKKNWYMDW